MATCPICRGYRFVYYDLPVNHPEFGRAQPCPQCLGGENGLRLRRLRESCRVPARFLQTRLLDFNETIREQVAKALRNGKKAHRFIYVFGPSGAGKTHLLTAVVNHVVENGVFAIYMRWPEFVQVHYDAKNMQVAESENERFRVDLRDLYDADVLAIDDIAADERSWVWNKLGELINVRYNRTSGLTLLASYRMLSREKGIYDEEPGYIETRLLEKGNYIISLQPRAL